MTVGRGSVAALMASALLLLRGHVIESKTYKVRFFFEFSSILRTVRLIITLNCLATGVALAMIAAQVDAVQVGAFAAKVRASAQHLVAEEIEI